MVDKDLVMPSACCGITFRQAAFESIIPYGIANLAQPLSAIYIGYLVNVSSPAATVGAGHKSVSSLQKTMKDLANYVRLEE